MSKETVTLTLRGVDHSYEIDTAAVDVMLAAFMSRHPPAEPEEGEKAATPEENFARQLRKYAEGETAGYAKDQDRQITPTMDAIKPFISG